MRSPYALLNALLLSKKQNPTVPAFLAGGIRSAFDFQPISSLFPPHRSGLKYSHSRCQPQSARTHHKCSARNTLIVTDRPSGWQAGDKLSLHGLCC